MCQENFVVKRQNQLNVTTANSTYEWPRKETQDIFLSCLEAK